jgi:hypothetical protein
VHDSYSVDGQRVTASEAIGERVERARSIVMDEHDTKERAVKILVRSLYRELIGQGFDDKQILAVAIELVGKVTDKMSQAQLKRRVA